MSSDEPAGATAARRDDDKSGRSLFRRSGDDDNTHDHARDLHDVPFEQRIVTKPAKTSTAAAFALAIGAAALVCVLSVLLSPIGLVLGVIGLVLGLVGLRASKRVGVTGRGVAIAGLVLSAIALSLSIAFAAGAVTVLNNDNVVNRLEQELDKLKDKLPENVDIPHL